MAQHLSIPDREALNREQMQRNADHFQTAIRPGMRNPAPSSIDIDADAKLYYIENIPFHGKYEEALEGRSFGAENGREAWSGRNLLSSGIWEWQQNTFRHWQRLGGTYFVPANPL